MKRSDFLKCVGLGLPALALPAVLIGGEEKGKDFKIWGCGFLGGDRGLRIAVHNGEGEQFFITYRKDDGDMMKELKDNWKDVKHRHGLPDFDFDPKMKAEYYHRMAEWCDRMARQFRSIK